MKSLKEIQDAKNILNGVFLPLQKQELYLGMAVFVLSFGRIQKVTIIELHDNKLKISYIAQNKYYTMFLSFHECGIWSEGQSKNYLSRLFLCEEDVILYTKLLAYRTLLDHQIEIKKHH